MKIHVSKIMNLQRCENEINVLLTFIWLTHSNDNRSHTGVIEEIQKCQIVPTLAECTQIDPNTHFGIFKREPSFKHAKIILPSVVFLYSLSTCIL